jgi:predicted nucleic acid-binding protein
MSRSKSACLGKRRRLFDFDSGVSSACSDYKRDTICASISEWMWAVTTVRIEFDLPEELVDELKDVISRPEFAKRLQTINQTSDEIVSDHLKHTKVIEAAALPPTVTGDPHLLRLGRYENVPILAVNAFLEQLSFES